MKTEYYQTPDTLQTFPLSGKEDLRIKHDAVRDQNANKPFGWNDIGTFDGSILLDVQ